MEVVCQTDFFTSLTFPTLIHVAQVKDLTRRHTEAKTAIASPETDNAFDHVGVFH